MSRKTMLVAATILLAAPALAQERSVPAMPGESRMGMEQDQAGTPHFAPVIGTEVRTQAGNTLGTISDVVQRQGALVAVIDVGEDLAAMGVDKKRIALDWELLSPAPSGDALVAGVTMGELAEAPEFLGEPTPPAPKLGD